ncbi:MAG: YidC/Oxa1 family membrane protein insertase [Gammaproteobacteria bacterium]
MRHAYVVATRYTKEATIRFRIDNSYMDNLRFILVVALSLVLLMLWQEWEKDYGVAVVQTAQQAAGEAQGVDVPVAPALPEVQSRAPSGTNNIPLTVKADEEPIKVKTDLFQISIGQIGGGIDKVELLKYPVALDTPNEPILLFNNTSPLFYVAQGGLLSKNGGPTHEARFTAQSSRYDLSAGENKLTVPLVWESDNGLKVTKIYEFTRDSYLVNIRYEIENQSGSAWTGRAYSQLQRSDPGRESRILYTYTGTVISSPEKRYEKLSFDDLEDENLNVDIANGWAAMLQHYFVSALVPATHEETNHFYTLAPEGGHFVIGVIAPTITVEPNTTSVVEQRLYMGPKSQGKLEKIAPGLELTVDYGVLWFLAKPLFWCLERFHGITGNWGWAIVLVTLMLKLIFFKLSAAGYKSMANMRRVQPRLMAIKDRYKGDRTRLNQAMMDIYKKEKINPLGGCFPILIQIPVFIALYWTLLESVELRQADFIFWLNDLSAPDRFYVLPLIMGVTMLIQQKLNPAPMDPVQQKVMSVLPVVFTVFFAFFPSGLVLYWVVNNILSIAQQWVITRSIDRAAASQS